MRRFTFLGFDVSISWVYLLSQMLFWQLMYLQVFDIHCCRCSFGNQCICKPLIFIVADALLVADVSATCFSLNLQMLFSLPGMYNCIYILPFLGFEDASFANFSSASHIFDNMRMLLIEISHPQPALSITCRYSPVKLRIFNPRKSTIVDIPTKITSAPPVRQSSAV